jgi:hypothetical protein
MALYMSMMKDSVIDANKDHLLVLKKLIKRRDNAFTPFLFSTITVNADKLFVLQADCADVQEGNEPLSDEQINYQEKNGFFEVDMVVRLNPAIKRGYQDRLKKVNRLVAITDDEKIKEWLSEKLLALDIVVSDIRLTDTKPIPCSKGKTTINEVYAFAKVMATSLSVLQDLLVSGIGKRKSYGFGMPIFKGTSPYTIYETVLTHKIK